MALRPARPARLSIQAAQRSIPGPPHPITPRFVPLRATPQDPPGSLPPDVPLPTVHFSTTRRLDLLFVEQLSQISNEIAQCDPETYGSQSEPIAVGRVLNVDEHEPSAGLEDPMQLGHGTLSVRIPAERHGVDDAVERAVLVGQRLDVSLPESGRETLPLQILPRYRHHLLVVVDAVGVELTRVLGQ